MEQTAVKVSVSKSGNGIIRRKTRVSMSGQRNNPLLKLGLHGPLVIPEVGSGVLIKIGT